MSYGHLTQEQRFQIHVLKSTGVAQKQIAERIQVSPATVSRELARNRNVVEYSALEAQTKAQARRSAASRRPKRLTAELKALVTGKLGLGWSPEQIAGRFKAEGVLISHETIYVFIWANKAEGGTLYKLLRHRGKKYRKRAGKEAGRGCIKNRVDIDERPQCVEDKIRLGDCEGDLIIGAQQKGAILTLVDRATKYLVMAKMQGKFAAQVPDLIKKCFERLPKHFVPQTITFDNGKEFSEHERITHETKAKCYFAKPYASWQRGLNEHTNGLIRGYLPKKTDLSLLTEAEIQAVEDALNNRPRKILQFRTPREAMLGLNSPQLIALGP